MTDLEDERHAVANPTLRMRVTIETRSRSRGLQVLELDPIAEPELVGVLATMLGDKSDLLALEVTEMTLARLAEIGAVLEEDEVPKRLLFSETTSDAIELPVQASAEELVVNGYLSDTPEFHAFVANHQRHISRFRPGLSMWSPTPGTGIVRPLWLDEEELAAVRAVRSSEAAAVSRETLDRLCALQVVATREKLEAQQRAWALHLDDRASQLAREGHAILRGLLSSSALSALRRYVTGLHESGDFTRAGDECVIDREYVHNDPIFRYFHHEISKVVNRVVGSPLKASYAFLAAYHSNAILPVHTDREQCEWNLSLAISDSAKRNGAQPWPIYVKTSSGTFEAHLQDGDALLYQGTRSPHWRECLGPDRDVTVALFHFVEADFVGSLD